MDYLFTCFLLGVQEFPPTGIADSPVNTIGQSLSSSLPGKITPLPSSLLITDLGKPGLG